VLQVKSFIAHVHTNIIAKLFFVLERMDGILGVDWLPEWSSTRLPRCNVLIIGCLNKLLGLAHVMQEAFSSKAQ
jgi:hypothetical protein